jgi:hypothetical protein
MSKDEHQKNSCEADVLVRFESAGSRRTGTYADHRRRRVRTARVLTYAFYFLSVWAAGCPTACCGSGEFWAAAAETAGVSTYNLSAPPAIAADTTFVPLKDWRVYTDEEKKFLRERWSYDKTEEVVRALKAREPLPVFDDTLSFLKPGYPPRYG